jgi:hypothetical protein
MYHCDSLLEAEEQVTSSTLAFQSARAARHCAVSKQRMVALFRVPVPPTRPPKRCSDTESRNPLEVWLYHTLDRRGRALARIDARERCSANLLELAPRGGRRDPGSAFEIRLYPLTPGTNLWDPLSASSVAELPTWLLCTRNRLGISRISGSSQRPITCHL